VSKSTTDAQHISYSELKKHIDQRVEEGFQTQSAVLFTIFDDLAAGGNKIIHGPDIAENLSEQFRNDHPNSAHLIDSLEHIEFSGGWYKIFFFEEKLPLSFGGSGGYLHFEKEIDLRLKISGSKAIILESKGVKASKSEKKGMSSFPLKSGTLDKNGKVTLKVKVTIATKTVKLDFAELFAD
jgi:hypothetical protein